MCVSEVTCADDEKEKGHAGRHTEGDLRAACRAGKKENNKKRPVTTRRRGNGQSIRR